MAWRDLALIGNVELRECVEQDLDSVGVVIRVNVEIDAHRPQITENFGYLRTLGIPIRRSENIDELIGVVIRLQIVRSTGNDYAMAAKPT